jgi:8-oxo-dGTP diphosphatase
MDKERPKVGIGVVVVRDGKILIGERLDGHGKNTYMIPGGHLEFGESFEDCAKREVQEETGLQDISIQGLISIGNDIAYEKHYVSIGILAESTIGEPYNAEPNKAQNWKWYNPHEIPEPFFLPSKKVVKNWLEGGVYSD